MNHRISWTEKGKRMFFRVEKKKRMFVLKTEENCWILSSNAEVKQKCIRMICKT